jgi:xylan 1,4-beta-xylosidase
MRGDRIQVTSSAAVGLDAILQSGVRGAPDIDGIATRSDREMSVLLWNYHDDDLAATAAPVRLSVSGLPAAVGRVLVEHFRIDDDHSNASTAWKHMGSPAQPTAEQYAILEASGQLQQLGSPAWTQVKDGKLQVEFLLPRQAVSLVRVSY